MEQEKIKTLNELLENAANGGPQDHEKLNAFLSANKLTYKDALKYKNASFDPKNDAVTTAEKRRLEKGKAVDDKKATRDALDVSEIAKAFGVDLENATEDGDLDVGGLEQYLLQRGVNNRVEGESSEEYKNRMVNGFENLGLNFYSSDDRALVRNSIAHYGLLDKRQKIADEENSGVGGFFRNVLFPRINERYQNDLLNGEGSETLDYVKDGVLDFGEDALMVAPNPVTGPLSVASKAKTLQKLYKNFKKGKKVLDKRTNANKMLRATGTVAGYGADAAAVPLVTEVADALVYDDPENVRSDFELEDVALGSLVNAFMPYRAYRTAKSAKNIARGENDLVDAVQTIASAKPIQKTISMAEPFVVNKAGKSDYVRNYVPVIVNEQKKKKERSEKKKEKSRNLHDKWSRGLAIPMPGDKDFAEYEEWRKNNIGSLAKYR